MQIKKEKILDELKAVLSTYPETDLDQKYVHFIFYGGSFKAIFEVEDRDRIYFARTVLFYSIPFFDYAMNCSDTIKTSRKLYKQIMLDYSHETATIDISDYGCSIKSRKYPACRSVFQINGIQIFVHKENSRQHNEH